jgi:transcription initiation factor IIE alpha subunit
MKNIEPSASKKKNNRHQIILKVSIKLFACPHCDSIIKIKKNLQEPSVITCAACNNTALITPFIQNGFTTNLFYVPLQKENKPSSYACPFCDNIISLNDSPEYSFIITCPHCNNKAQYEHEDEEYTTPFKPLKKFVDDSASNQLKKNQELAVEDNSAKNHTRWLQQPTFRARMIGVSLLLMGGMLYFYSDNSILINLGISLFLIGIISLLLISEKKFIIINSSRQTKDNLIPSSNLLFSEKMTLALSLLVFIIFFVTNTVTIEMFFILIYLGILIIKELTDELTPVHIKKRLNLLITGFFLIFIIFIANHVMSII